MAASKQPGIAGNPKVRIGIEGAARTDVGRVRLVNEDSVFFYRPSDPVELEARGALALVADGMGGANGGRVASEMTSNEVTQAYFASKLEPAVALQCALQLASHQIFLRARSDGELTGMGSTCVALALKPPFAWAAWAGDSRVYLIRGGQIFQMTEDHSVVNEMVRQGLITQEAAFTHEDRNVLTRVIGTQPNVQAAVWPEPYPVRPGDRFLLCSDGLHGMMESSVILEVGGTGTAEDAAAHLIDEANSRGGHDNISAVVVDVIELGPPAEKNIRPTRELTPENVGQVPNLPEAS